MGRALYTGVYHDRRSGFTLIEVLIAMSILSLGLSIFLVSASRCLAVMKLSKVYKTVRWTLDQGYVDHPVVRSDEIEDIKVMETRYPNGMTYSREIEPMDDDVDEDSDCLFLIHSKVTWSNKGKTASSEIVRCVFHKGTKE
ncbi:MAG: prepilin-type N-terminal cleavage/methylation domain-containing protein [Lentisphaerae bacterium]|nr:prepilin-type N-terminal cleavage/methylation domain-containing protein [Lentisphaerota bacterium]